MIEMSDKLRKTMEELKINSSETYYHCVRVKSLVFKMIMELNKRRVTSFTKEETESICKGALLHDIGKLKVKNVILTKETSLTPEEKEHMAEHTNAGFEMVKEELGSNEMEIVKNICIRHHERIAINNETEDEALPMYVRIVSVCDVYDALRSYRVYRDAIGRDETMNIIKKGECGNFDGVLVQALEKITADAEL